MITLTLSPQEYQTILDALLLSELVFNKKDLIMGNDFAKVSRAIELHEVTSKEGDVTSKSSL